MSVFVTGPVSVEVPATSANLGPGFDSFGLALDFGDSLSAEVTAAGWSVDVSGEGADSVPRDEGHLVVRAMNAAFAEMSVQPDGVRLSCRNRIPHSRGLGSSSAAIVGGIRLAVALVADPVRRLDGDAMLQLANRLEGHPDNVAPALLGGFVISGQDGEEVWAHEIPTEDPPALVTFVPPEGLDTEVARTLLPEQVSHRDAAANSARAALLALGLGGDHSLLMRGTEDFLHQHQREPAMPASIELVRHLRESGVPAAISGAGPTVLAFVPRAEARSVDEVLAWAPAGWQADARALARCGVRVVPA